MYNDNYQGNAILVYILIMLIILATFAYIAYLGWKHWKKNHNPNPNLIHNEAIAELAEVQYHLQQAQDKLEIAQKQFPHPYIRAAILDIQEYQEQITQTIDAIYAANEHQQNKVTKPKIPEYPQNKQLYGREDWEHLQH